MSKYMIKYSLRSNIIIFLLTLLFLSCTENSIEKSNKFKVEDCQIIFFVEDSSLNETVDSLLQITFASPIEGLLQSEPLFSTVIVNSALEVTNSLNKQKNVLQVIKIISSTAEDINSQMIEKDFLLSIYWDNDINKLYEELKKLMLIVEKKELEVIRKSFSRNSQKNIQTILENNFGVKTVIPKKYKTEIERDDLFLAAYDPSDREEIKKICIFSFNYDKTDLSAQVLANVDSVFKTYFLGEEKETYATIEKNLPVSYYNNTYRGIWRLKGGFMGGVFIIKTYKMSSKITVCVGFVFDPANTKRMHVKEFEAIL
tara:strand:- start:44937 stop:45878 length:942 start_codon:yes stop_codon:yes gene_type:complete